MVATRRLAAIMFTDMVGYTAATQTDEAATLRRLEEQEELVRPLFAVHQGREVKSTGDGFLVEFDSALRAVQCAIEIHQRLHERNSQTGVTPIQLRIGVHLGDVEERGTDIFGDAVNIAARIEPLAPPGGLVISGQIFDQVRNKIPNRLERLEPTALKNVRIPVHVYRVGLPWDSSEPRSADASRTRLAVLPLANISPDPKDEYFADGLTEELINSLSKLRELRVIARTSVGQYKSTSKSIAQIGAELEVGTVLEGSVRKAGNRLRITLQLIDAATQEHIWSNSYDRELNDVFAIQTEIAERTAGVLRLGLLAPERESIRARPTSNLVAYDLYLRGIHAANQSTRGGIAASIKLFEQAITEDPEFSLAYSYLANAYIGAAGESRSPREAFPRAKELVSKALELDPNSSDAHTAWANLALQDEQNWALAEAEFKRAISINPSNPRAHFWYSILLAVVRRFDEAAAELRTAMELDPLWQQPRVWLTLVYPRSRDFTWAVASLEEDRDRDPSNAVPHIRLGLLYLRAGRLDEARRESALADGPVSNYLEFDRAILRAAFGAPDEARQLVGAWQEARKTTYVPPTWIAALHAVLGENEQALDWLERDYQEGDRILWLDYQLPAFDTIRHDPRFRAMLARLHVPAEGDRTDETPADAAAAVRRPP